MLLRTRIAVTFFLLVAAVLATALAVVSAANRHNAEREVGRQLDVGARVFMRAMETNREQLTQAAQAVAADYAFKEAVALRDTDTLASALQNAGSRLGAAVEVLTTLHGRVLAASGINIKPGMTFPLARLLRARGVQEGNSTIMVADGRIYQLVAVQVRSPLPVAWVVMGFALDTKAARELAAPTALALTMSVRSGSVWTTPITTVPDGGARRGELVTRSITLVKRPRLEVVATLSRSLTAALAPFERLTRVLYLIAGASLVGSAFAAFWLARNITRPLRQLTDAVDHIRGGAYDVPVSIHRRDELGVLAEGLQVMQRAVSTRDQAIRRLAYDDPLTGLMNRTAFVEALTAALGAASAGPVAVALINLHRFKRINEHLGFAVGDAVLVKIAARLTAPPAAGTAVARLNADQFALFAHLPPGADATAWGLALQSRLAEPAVVHAQPLDVHATIGLATAPADAAVAEDLMRCADLALEFARREKRAFAAYLPTLTPSARDQLSLLGELRRALDADELRLYFQPKWEISSRRIAAAEVLLRWQHPARGLLGPGVFLPFAEQTGFIRQITRWTLDRAAAQGAAWQKAGVALPLAINVTVDDLADTGFHLSVARALEHHGLDPALLTLEVTESGFIDDPKQALRMLQALATLGVKLSIDDFGTGYSSLSHLAHMPVDEVKIDQSFVRQLEADPEVAAVVRSAIDMGHRLGLRVVAEGIETESAAALLGGMHCDLGQGFLIAKPMPLAQFESWLRGRDRVAALAVPAARADVAGASGSRRRRAIKVFPA